MYLVVCWMMKHKIVCSNRLLLFRYFQFKVKQESFLNWFTSNSEFEFLITSTLLGGKTVPNYIKSLKSVFLCSFKIQIWNKTELKLFSRLFWNKFLSQFFFYLWGPPQSNFLPQLFCKWKQLSRFKSSTNQRCVNLLLC